MSSASSNHNIEIVPYIDSLIDETARLFNHYRQFYKQNSDVSAARTFIEGRQKNRESVIFLAKYEDQFVGFTQLYPVFSSVGMGRVWILNDLFVEEAFRRKGVAKLLIVEVLTFAKQTDAVRVTLETATDNTKAQALYDALGFKKQNSMFHYTYSLKNL